MKTKMILIALALLASLPAAFSQITIPSDGSDGALNVTAANLVIDLSQAVTGTFSDNNTAIVGKGIYDPMRWAIVFKYGNPSFARLFDGGKVRSDPASRIARLCSGRCGNGGLPANWRSD